ncbi:unnamed protein product (plasmid) [Mycetohabitans rhizoxinica HKI 454]|uniref:Uncharacterized protein n=1 Tax=Mycetohabitans rhizoxinica (strain DSM 19002 / CIP 109453 / HKI 454) TaxID=882378 RepID=E5AV14_MYCRK|nr:unnamed protein product [Mycetohabitans rhizoxinica HKI 454]
MARISGWPEDEDNSACWRKGAEDGGLSLRKVPSLDARAGRHADSEMLALRQ